LIDSDCPGDGPGPECLPGAFGVTSGERAQATFKVTLQQPKPFKEDPLLPTLKDIRDNAAINDNTKSKLDTVIDKIEISVLDKFWIDDLTLNEADGQTVFQEEEAAAKELATILALPPNGQVPLETNQDVLDLLREMLELIETDDRILSEQAIVDADNEGSPAGGGSCLANAINEMVKAENSLILLDFENAINFREAAWVFAQLESIGRTCDPPGAPPPPPPAPLGDVITEDVDGDILIVATQTVTITNSATISGSIKVEGGTLIVTDGVTIEGKIEGFDGATVTIQDSSVVKGDVLVSGSGSILELIDSTVEGKVVTTETDSVIVTNNTVDSDILSDKDGDVTITGNTVGGKIEIKETNSCTQSGNGSPPDGNSGCP